MSVKSALKSLPGVRRLWAVLRILPGARTLRESVFGTWQDAYWKSRKHLRYYNEVLRLGKQWAGDAKTVIDVGSGNLPLILKLEWIPSKTSLDLYRKGRLPRCENIKADFMAYAPPISFDLVLCLQVLEHLECPDAFVEKLLRTGKIVLISVPYRWPEGQSPHHVQDPIDENKLLAWTKKPWLDHVVVKEANGEERIIVVLQGNEALTG
jgi:SAM-dependent methyltransferase